MSVSMFYNFIFNKRSKTFSRKYTKNNCETSKEFNFFCFLFDLTSLRTLVVNKPTIHTEQPSHVHTNMFVHAYVCIVRTIHTYVQTYITYLQSCTTQWLYVALLSCFFDNKTKEMFSFWRISDKLKVKKFFCVPNHFLFAF